MCDASLRTTRDLGRHFLHALHGFKVITSDFVNVLGEEITHGALNEFGFLEAADGCAFAVTLAGDIIPLLDEKAEISDDVARDKLRRVLKHMDKAMQFAQDVVRDMTRGLGLAIDVNRHIQVFAAHLCDEVTQVEHSRV
jgi:hypothetical protein